MLAQGDIFAGCRIITICGEGTYGTVYLAEDAAGRRVALKVFDSAKAGEHELRGIRNYMRLPEGAAGLVAIHHAGLENGRFFYLMELADNVASEGNYSPDTLARRLKLQGRLPLDEALDICHRLLDGLETMHGAGLLHRDIKPENILFVHGAPKLGDPGLTGDFTHTLSVAGTLGYIPPELFNAAEKPSTGSDIYALGKVLYCMVTGNAPGQFPSLPADLDRKTRLAICVPLARLCHPRPQKRCADCATCRQLLAEAVRRRNPLQRCWLRLRHGTLPMSRAGLFATAFLVAGLIIALLGWLRFSRAMRLPVAEAPTVAELPSSEPAVSETRLRQYQSREAQLHLQLAELDGAPDLQARLDEIQELQEHGQVAEAQDALDRLDAELALLAEANLPAPAAPDAPLAERFHQNARAYGYLASPLGTWFLPEESRQSFFAKTETEAAALQFSSPRVTLRNGQDLHCFAEPSFQMKFVPPGNFLSPTTGAAESIDYPFWMLDTEFTFKLFDYHSKSRHRESGQGNQPATQIAWDEMLACCQRLTSLLQMDIDLPPGYAIRLPTEAEWEYAAMGGAAAPAFVSESIPAADEASPVRSGPPNPLGLLQMDRNLSEVIGIPYPGLEPQESYAIIRGTNFQYKRTGIKDRGRMRLDQITLTTIGFRPVLAPTSDEFPEALWFHANPLRTAACGEKFYAGLECCQVSFSWPSARKVAEKLGGRLPEPASPDEVAEIFQCLQADTRYPAFLGITYQDGAWRSVTDHQPAPLGDGLPPPAENSTRRCLTAQPSYPNLPVAEDVSRPNLIVEWSSREAFENRPQYPCEETFVIDGRHFGILRIRVPSTIQAGFLQLARHRPPAPIPPETLQKLLERLADCPGAVSLGAWRAVDGWRWQDNTPLDLPEPPAEYDFNSLDNIYHCILVVHDGHLKYSSTSEALLVELE